MCLLIVLAKHSSNINTGATLAMNIQIVFPSKYINLKIFRGTLPTALNNDLIITHLIWGLKSSNCIETQYAVLR